MTKELDKSTSAKSNIIDTDILDGIAISIGVFLAPVLAVMLHGTTWPASRLVVNLFGGGDLVEVVGILHGLGSLGIAFFVLFAFVRLKLERFYSVKTL